MSQKITCPHCKKEFPMEQGLESHFNDLKQSVINETKKPLNLIEGLFEKQVVSCSSGADGMLNELFLLLILIYNTTSVGTFDK